MKKSIVEQVRARQKRKFVAPASQEPGNEKPEGIGISLKSLKNRIIKNDFLFLKTIKLKHIMPLSPGPVGDISYAATGKPW